MAVETPARIVVLGAGPIGVETALYARFLGYEVTLVDRGEVGANLHSWGHVPLFTPFGMNRTSLGLAALKAQDPDFNFPADDEILTAAQYVRRYLLPLAESDLIVDGLKRGHEVLAVGRKGKLKGDDVGRPERAETPFLTLVRDYEGHQSVIESEVVIDCTGVLGNPGYLGDGGLPAIGELGCREYIEFGIPDFSGDDRDQYAARHTLVIGQGYTAATNIVNLSRLAREALDTHVTWITRKPDPAESRGPIPQIADDRLPRRAQLATEANRVASHDDGHITHWPETTVQAIHRDAHSQHFSVTLTGRHAGIHTFDRVIANVGYRPDWRPQQELQLALCYATEGPLKLAAHLLEQSTADCLTVEPGEGQLLLNPEPNFYVLGTKSYGRNSNFLLQSGYQQIRQVFAIIGDREDLDLYAPLASLPTGDA